MEGTNDFSGESMRMIPECFEQIREESPQFFFEVVAPLYECPGTRVIRLSCSGTAENLDLLSAIVVSDLQSHPGVDIILACSTSPRYILRALCRKMFAKHPDLRQLVVKHNADTMWLQMPAAAFAGSEYPSTITVVGRHPECSRNWRGVHGDVMYVVD